MTPDGLTEPWITSDIAAVRLGVTPRRVLQLAQEKAIDGHHGADGHWQLSSESVDLLVKRRPRRVRLSQPADELMQRQSWAMTLRLLERLCLAVEQLECR